jgi:hypothetical protein
MVPDSRVVAFYGAVDDKKYRAVLVKQSRSGFYFWSWYDESGTVISVDLLKHTKRIFYGVRGGHRSYHRDGKSHTVVEMLDSGKAKKEELTSWSGWRDFEITIPLDGIPSEAPAHAPWREVTREIVLRSSDFTNAAGVNLIFCLATPERVAGLKRQWRKHWILNSERTLLVGAEPIPTPC